jgi:hypothetical protein
VSGSLYPLDIGIVLRCGSDRGDMGIGVALQPEARRATLLLAEEKRCALFPRTKAEARER